MINRQKIIAKSFQGNSSLEIIRLLSQKGFSNTQDLVRISGASLSNILKINKSMAKPELTNLIGVKLGSDEVHFYELLSKSISLGLIKGEIIFYGEKDFVKSLLDSYGNSFKGVEVREEVFNEINLESDKLKLSPNVGGSFAKSLSVDLLSRIEDLSVKQLDLLYKGISQHNPNHEFLSKIESTLKEKING